MFKRTISILLSSINRLLFNEDRIINDLFLFYLVRLIAIALAVAAVVTIISILLSSINSCPGMGRYYLRNVFLFYLVRLIEKSCKRYVDTKRNFYST